VREDADNGRVYLPAEDLRRFGVICQGRDSVAGGPSTAEVLATIAHGGDRAGGAQHEQTANSERERLVELMRFEAGRARDWFARGIALTSLLDRRSAACVTAMAGIYRRLLARIESHPEQALGRRISLPAHEKAWVAARSVLGVGLGR
jgi:15-cis-phytoene synthase